MHDIKLGDCRTYLKNLKDNSIDMCLTDPPYFLNKLDDNWSLNQIEKYKRGGVVPQLPCAMKYDRNQGVNFRLFYDDIAKEIFRVLKPGGFFINFSSPRLYHHITMSVEDAGFNIRDMIGWVHTNQSQLKAFSQNHFINKNEKLTEEEKNNIKTELNGFKTPQLKPVLEPLCIAQKPIENTYVNNWLKYKIGLINFNEKTGDNKYLSNIITTDKISEQYDTTFLIQKPSKKEKKEYNNHLSVKPIELCSKLINIFTPSNAIILDPFIGSGTTAISALTNNRSIIGYELKEEYLNICKKRIYDINSSSIIN